MRNVTPVPNGPLVKKKGEFKGSTLKNGGKSPARKLKKAQVGKSISAADSVLKYSRLAQKQIDTLQNPKTSDKTYKEVYKRLRGSTLPQEKKWMDVATGRKPAPKQRSGGTLKKKK
jgi:transposase